MILSAGMGAGHDTVADELARRLAQAGHLTEKVDVLRLLPAGTGRALRRCYAAMIQHAVTYFRGLAMLKLFNVLAPASAME